MQRLPPQNPEASFTHCNTNRTIIGFQIYQWGGLFGDDRLRALPWLWRWLSPTSCCVYGTGSKRNLPQWDSAMEEKKTVGAFTLTILYPIGIYWGFHCWKCQLPGCYDILASVLFKVTWPSMQVRNVGSLRLHASALSVSQPEAQRHRQPSRYHLQGVLRHFLGPVTDEIFSALLLSHHAHL